ncbi:MAG: VCBS repeat-containing protein, partial [Rubripirellula sp.]
MSPSTLSAQGRHWVTSDRMSLGTETNRSASVRMGDLDGDRDLDIVVANGRHWPQQNFVVFNHGAAKFTLMQPLGEDRRTTYACELADFDGDGDLDIATGNDMAPGRIFLNDGSGRVTVHTEFSDVSSVRSLTLADIDGDGDVDILATSRGRPNRIYLNDGVANFQPGPTFGQQADSTIDVAVADIDRDGRPDLVLANRDRQPNEVLLADKDLKFTRRVVFGNGKDNTRAVVVADMNDDGHLDWVTGNIGQANAIYLGDGKGGVKTSMSLGQAASRTYSLAVADMDNDGDLDVVAGNVAQRNSVYLNAGDGSRFIEEPFGDPDSVT